MNSQPKQRPLPAVGGKKASWLSSEAGFLWLQPQPSSDHSYMCDHKQEPRWAHSALRATRKHDKLLLRATKCGGVCCTAIENWDSVWPECVELRRWTGSLSSGSDCNSGAPAKFSGLPRAQWEESGDGGDSNGGSLKRYQRLTGPEVTRDRLTDEYLP